MRTATNELSMPSTPPRWINALVVLLLHTPLLQRLLGRTFAVMTVTGSKSGRRYTVPVQYLDHDGELVVLSQRMRKWWRNIATRPDVEMRVEGRSTRGHARIANPGEARSILVRCLSVQPRVAKFYGVQPNPDGDIEIADVERLLERVVVLVVTLQLIDVELEPADVVIQGF